MTRQWDLEVDFLVAGSGAAGLSAAITTKRNGLDVFLVETEARWGGTTCLSGGGLWMPNNPLMHRDGVQDSFEEALAYMEATIGDVGPHTSLRGSSEGLVWTRAWRRFGDSGSVRIGKQYSFRDGANLPGAGTSVTPVDSLTLHGSLSAKDDTQKRQALNDDPPTARRNSGESGWRNRTHLTSSARMDTGRYSPHRTPAVSPLLQSFRRVQA